jgi:ubiquinone/menaquinone biosynthesis C-methylase UbiE
MTEGTPGVSFSDAVAEVYDRHLVPMIFEPYALDITQRLGALEPSRVLEVAAGTGAVTRTIAAQLPSSVALVATDLSPSMIDHATKVGTARPVEWQVADALNLPFPADSFDAVVCQFGVMFFPDRVAGYREMLRVLRAGGQLLFNVWDRIEHNDFAHVVHAAIAARYPDDPPVFMERIPHGYFQADQIRADLLAAGFDGDITIDEVGARSVAPTSEIVARAYCYGTPTRNFLEARGEGELAASAATAAAALAKAFGRTDLDGRINAFVISAQAPA